MGDNDCGRIGILIPVYERTEKLERTLWSIEQNLDVEAEVVVAEGRQCVAKNRRDALGEFDGDLVLFMDDDVILPPFFASKLLQAYEQFPDAGVVSAIMTAPDGSRQNHCFCKPDQMLETVPPGTCFLYSKSRVTTKDKGGPVFDIHYEASQWEDTDFMAQVLERGLKTYCAGSVWILHDNNWTEHTDETWERNRERFKKKWPEWSKQFDL